MAFSLARLRLPDISRAELRFFAVLARDTQRRVERSPLKPEPETWPNDGVTAAWLGHSTVLINFFGIHILTDPVLGNRAGLRFGPFTLGPKRYVASALAFRELPRIDLILLSHAHMDHFDLRTLATFEQGPRVITARRTADLLRGTKLRDDVTELAWGERTRIPRSGGAAGAAADGGALEIEAFEVRHWGARMRTDDFRGYNGYILRRGGRAILFAGDTAFTPLFSKLRGRGGDRAGGGFDLAILPIGAYDPWIGSHCTPEQAIEMANEAGARFLMPVHHQTFKLSQEPMDDPIRRFERALHETPERVAVRGIGETFRLPLEETPRRSP